MKTKRVNRYYCEFCKKQGGSAGHMRKHEKRCTMNPERECGVCLMVKSEEEPRPLTHLINMFPDLDDYTNNNLLADAREALKRVRDAAKNCPACILAALRQSGYACLLDDAFDFEEEMRFVWPDVNQHND